MLKPDPFVPTRPLWHRTKLDPCNRHSINEADLIERILRHLGLWDPGVRVESARDPPEPTERVIEPWLDDPFPDYDHEPVFAQD